MEGVEWRTDQVEKGVASDATASQPKSTDRRQGVRRGGGEDLSSFALPFRKKPAILALPSPTTTSSSLELLEEKWRRKEEGEEAGFHSSCSSSLFLVLSFLSPTLSTRPRCRRGRLCRRGRTRGAKWRRRRSAGPPARRSVGRRGIPLSLSLLILLLERGEWTGRRPSFLRPIDRRKEGGGPPPPLYSLSLLLLLRSFRPSSASVSVANAGREEGEDERERCAASVAHVI